jgi:hypothetical protein
LPHPKWTQISSQFFLMSLLQTCEARGAEAKESSWEIKAAGSGGAGAAQTLIHLCLTVWSFKAYDTGGVSGNAFCLPPSLPLQGLSPSLPGRHSQWKAPGWSWQRPPLVQGLLLHSSMSSSHWVPVNPGGKGSGMGRGGEGHPERCKCKTAPPLSRKGEPARFPGEDAG